EGFSCPSPPVESRVPEWLPNGFTRRSAGRVGKGTGGAGAPPARPQRRTPVIEGRFPLGNGSPRRNDVHFSVGDGSPRRGDGRSCWGNLSPNRNEVRPSWGIVPH